MVGQNRGTDQKKAPRPCSEKPALGRALPISSLLSTASSNHTSKTRFRFRKHNIKIAQLPETKSQPGRAAVCGWWQWWSTPRRRWAACHPPDGSQRMILRHKPLRVHRAEQHLLLYAAGSDITSAISPCRYFISRNSGSFSTDCQRLDAGQQSPLLSLSVHLADWRCPRQRSQMWNSTAV